MNVLADTCIWVDHFKNRNDTLIQFIRMDLILTHPMIITELACGTPPAPRKKTLADIQLLKSANQISLPEVRNFIEQKKLYGLGCGLVDITLLASALITPDTKLWTLDKRLSTIANNFDILYQAEP